jgi:D-amino-acid dehydrogenase
MQGVYYPYARHARNPKKILLKLFDLFLKKGGKFNKVNIKILILMNKNLFLKQKIKVLFLIKS